MSEICSALELLIWVIVLGNAAYLVLAIASVLAHRPGPAAPQRQTASVTVLKPLCGFEPGLALALESFLSQKTEAPVRFVFGVASGHDPALQVVRSLAARHPERQIDIRVDGRRHGANPKVDNLVNMAEPGLDEIVVVSDSDIVIPPGALQRLLDQFVTSKVGAVTTLYRGRPGRRGNRAQYMGALYLDGWFLPTAVLHARLASPQVCYGPMTAIRREVLDRAGGFAGLANRLADDTELGLITREQGRTIAFSPDTVETWVADESLRALFVHELRWARTIRRLEPVGYLASVFMHPGPIPLLLALGAGLPGWLAAFGVMLLRWLLVQTVWRRFGRAQNLSGASPLALWLREQLYFAVWICGFFGRSVVWRGRQLMLGSGANLEPAVALPEPELL